MQSLTPIPANWAPAGWQSYMGLMIPARALGTSLTSGGLTAIESQVDIGLSSRWGERAEARNDPDQ